MAVVAAVTEDDPAMRSLLALSLLLLLALPAPAVILKLVALRDAIEQMPIIFTASVEKTDPDKPALYLKFDAKLKGDATFDTLAVNMTGSAEAKKGNHTKAMFERLDTSRKLVVFANKVGDAKYDAWAFCEGTWFSMHGTIDADKKTVRWAFQHGEPYLRRTFKGTTAELKKVVEDALAKKADPPGPNEKEPPGFGPVSEKKCGVRNSECGIETQPTHRNDSGRSAAVGSYSAFRIPNSALFGVIPSLALLGPMALLAALFPGLAARMAVGMKKWRAFLVIASVNSTLAIVFFFVQKYLPNAWVFSLQGFTVVLLGVTAVGLCWAGRRYRRLAAEDATVTATPGRAELKALLGLTVATVSVAASSRFFGPWRTALELPMREFTFIAIALLVATLYAVYRGITRSADGPSPTVRLSLSGESVGLGVLFLCGLLAVTSGKTTTFASGTVAGEVDEIGPRYVGVSRFVVADADQVMSGVTVSGDKVYFGAMRSSGFGVAGLAFCLDRHTGGVVWKFDNGGALKPVFCTPTVADGRAYFGEGLHTDAGCKLYCLDATTGKPAWEKPFETGSHTEGTPRVFDGKVAFSAGDDGLFAADAKTGEKRWHFQGTEQKLHIDTPPTVVGNRLFAGSGYLTNAAVCLDATTGKEVWKQPVPFRSFAAPLALGNRVFYGLGTGILTQDTEGDEKEPGGAVICLNADDGREVWKYDLTRSAHGGLAADGFSIYATSRDGFVHCIERATGKLRWKTGVGGAVMSGAAVASAGGMPVAVYAVSREGRVVCLNPHTGRVVWEKQLPGFTWDGQDANGVLGTPAVVTDGNKRSLYVGAMTVSENTRRKACAVFRFDDEIPE